MLNDEKKQRFILSDRGRTTAAAAVFAYFSGGFALLFFASRCQYCRRFLRFAQNCAHDFLHISAGGELPFCRQNGVG